MIADWTSLQADILTWVDRTDLTAVAPALIRLGEAKIYRELRLRSMEATLNVTIAAGVAPIPADFLELKNAYINGDPVQPVQSKDSEFIYRKYPKRVSDGKPRFVAQEADNFIFGPFPDDTYTVKGIYYKRLTVLSASNTTNYFTGDGADLLFWASLSEAEAYLKRDPNTQQPDPRIQLWEQKYQAAKAMIKKQRSRERIGNGPHRSTEG